MYKSQNSLPPAVPSSFTCADELTSGEWIHSEINLNWSCILISTHVDIIVPQVTPWGNCPEMSMVDWTSGAGNARWWTLKMFNDGLGHGDKDILPSCNTDTSVYVRGLAATNRSGALFTLTYKQTNKYACMHVYINVRKRNR